MVIPDRREHERILLEKHTRLWLQEKYRGKDVQFEGFANTRNLSISGTFLESTYLLPPGFPINLEVFLDESEVLAARGQVAHCLTERDEGGPGMGIAFTAVDLANRELLLRFFVSDRIRDFYEHRFIAEFPQLEAKLSLQDVALVVNLWEDREGRLTELMGGATARARQPAPNADAPSGAGRRKR